LWDLDPRPEPAYPELDLRPELTSFLQNCTPNWGFFVDYIQVSLEKLKIALQILLVR
jgi:hypothetical protein